MKYNRFIIIGFNEIGQALLERLSKDFEITVITQAEEAEERLKELKREDVKLIKGDPTSRLVLEDAEVETADVVAVTTMDERVNLESVDIITKNFHPRRVISVSFTHEGTARLEEMGIEVINIYTASATGIRNKIEMRTKAALEIGLGKDEILEVEVHPHSKLANKPLGHLAPIRWRVGILYRDGNIIIPKRDTILRPRDRVVLLGDPQVLRTVAEILTFSFDQFPLEYGSIGIIYISGREDGRFIEEMNYVFSSFNLEKTIVILSERARGEGFRQLREQIDIPGSVFKETSLPLRSAIDDTLYEAEGKQGLIALSDRSMRASALPWMDSPRKRRFINDLISAARCPLLIARGTFPYEHVCFPCVEGVDVEHVLETAFEISIAVNNTISSLHVRPSTYISDENAFKDFEEDKRTVSEMSLVYKTKVERVELTGNPIHAVTGALGSGAYELLLTDTPAVTRRGIPGLLNPDVRWGILKRSSLSTLITPPLEEAL